MRSLVPWLFLGAVICSVLGHPVTFMYLQGATNGWFPSTLVILVCFLLAIALDFVLVFYCLLKTTREKYFWRVLGVSLACGLFLSWLILYFAGPMGIVSFDNGFARWGRGHIDVQGVRQWALSVNAVADAT